MVSLDGRVLRVSVPLTMTVARGVVEAGLPHLKGGDIEVDLSAVPEADSSALAVLLAWQREQKRRGGSLRVIGVPAGLSSIARVYGADSEIDGIAPGDGR